MPQGGLCKPPARLVVMTFNLMVLAFFFVLFAFDDIAQRAFHHQQIFQNDDIFFSLLFLRFAVYAEAEYFYKAYGGVQNNSENHGKRQKEQ